MGRSVLACAPHTQAKGCIERRATRRWSALLCVLASTLLLCAIRPAQAQRSSENAVAEALDAFGTTVGHEAIGLYSATNTRGFNPVQAGNLRIEGVYFDQINMMATPSNRIIRSQALQVGIASQGYLFPSPTGVVDYHLRTPGNELVASQLVGGATYGVVYSEADVQVPIVSDVLSMGAGIGYTHNGSFDMSARGDEWTLGWIGRWQPSATLEVIPFWDVNRHKQYAQKPNEFVDHAGVPRFYPVDAGTQPWAHAARLTTTSGAIARWSFADRWQLTAGLFRSLIQRPHNYIPSLMSIDGDNQGDYQITGFPPNTSGSTSGEARLATTFGGQRLRNAVYVRVAARSSSVVATRGDTKDYGLANISDLPQVVMPVFQPGTVTDVRVHQVTPGLAYRAVWQSVGQLTLNVQKVLYHRTVLVPGQPEVSDSSSPWLYGAAASASITPTLTAYGSYTKGFEEIGTAPFNASNRNEPVPAQLTKQIDAGLKYQLLPKLQLVTGVFQIDKPYFNLDTNKVFRLLGDTSNRGFELSLTGNLTDRLNVVSGVVLIKAPVRYNGVVDGLTNAVAIGPIPGYMTTYVQYHPASIAGLILGVTVQTDSSRYAAYPDVNLPAVTTVGADIRYTTQLFGEQATFWLRGYNLSSAYGLTANVSGQLMGFDPRRFELSLVMDL